MKKIIILCMAILICVLSCACAKSVPDEESIADQNTTESTTDSITQSVSSEPYFSSVGEYVDYVFANADNDDFTTEYMTYTVYADQNIMVYDYTYLEQFDNVDVIRDRLNSAYDPKNEAVQDLLSQLRSNVNTQEPKIKYIYRNNDGTIITEQLYE